ncbi:MAG: CDP-diacylglycerol--glycerol-3-phosphate 3-phosphatidyltransferase [Ruminococcaceae bacterium]|nr:CDP-diacylglycerol--glycerol-3-phosphate 3-phosphatidyltransferase [Oscillospiraceae bacterium]
MKLKNIPNILSIIRIILVFVFVAVFFVADSPVWALIIFLTAGATDIVDGYLARRFNWITNLGKILDPFADKFMQCTALICLCIKSFVPLWFVLVFLVKELATLITGLLVIKRRSVVVVSKWYGKAAVCLFYLAIFICIVFRTFLEENPIVSIIMFATVAIFAMLAFTGYVKHYSVLKKQEIEKGTIRKVIK